MRLLVSMPRGTNTSLFTNHISQGIFLVICLLGIVFATLVFVQNYRSWQEKRRKHYDDELRHESDIELVNYDFFCSFLIFMVIIIFIVSLVLYVGVRLIG